MLKNLVVLLFAVCLVNVEANYGVSSTADFLIDHWFEHSATLLNNTNNQNYAVEGLNFITTSMIYLTNETIQVRTDLGVIKGLNYIMRNGPVTVKDSYSSENEVGTISVSFDVIFSKSLSVHYPFMYISGQGVRISYEGVDIYANGEYSTISVPLKVTLKYSNKSCSTDFDLDVNNYYVLKGYVSNPKMNLPLNSDMETYLFSSIKKAVHNHFSTFINYENICEKLLHLI